MNEIQALRYQTGLSQSKFAEKFKISVRTLQQWEQNISTPPEYTYELLRRLVRYDGLLSGRYSLDSYRLAPMQTFKICIDDPFPNCEKIYPIQQRKVRALIDDIIGHAAPSKILVFGSSVTEHCHIGSDVDLYAELSSDINPIRNIHDFEYDFWSNFTVDDRLYAEIQNKGVIVYG